MFAVWYTKRNRIVDHSFPPEKIRRFRRNSKAGGFMFRFHAPGKIMIVAALCSSPAPALAKDPQTPQACIDAQLQAGAPPAECVNRHQAECFQYEEGSAASLSCFLKAKDDWGDLIKERMDQIAAAAPEEIRAIAGIEVKYDLQANLLQCDRMRELTLVRKDPDDATAVANARCEATAVGLAYVKLYLQSNDIK
jgi:hypothetical protein